MTVFHIDLINSQAFPAKLPIALNADDTTPTGNYVTIDSSASGFSYDGGGNSNWTGFSSATVWDGSEGNGLWSDVDNWTPNRL